MEKATGKDNKIRLICLLAAAAFMIAAISLILNITRTTEEKPLEGVTVFLAGDSRSSTDYTFYGELLERKSGCKALVQGASGMTTAYNASNEYFARLEANPHDFSIWLVGGNDPGSTGTVGTFNSRSLLSEQGEPLVTETDITEDYNGSTFIQAVDHIMRKYKALYYDFTKRTDGRAPIMIFCTDLPQQRDSADNEWSVRENWERKRLAILECCEKNHVLCLDLYALCPFDLAYEPMFTAPTDMINNRGIYYMDGLHPNQYGMDMITSLETDMMSQYRRTR